MTATGSAPHRDRVELPGWPTPHPTWCSPEHCFRSEPETTGSGESFEHIEHRSAPLCVDLTEIKVHLALNRWDDSWLPETWVSPPDIDIVIESKMSMETLDFDGKLGFPVLLKLRDGLKLTAALNEMMKLAGVTS